MRKYEYETGRFISIDPLWGNYYGWTPYQYSRNNPINAIDINGGAEFFLSDGNILNDQVNDGKLYASGNFDVNNSKIFNDDGSSTLDFNLLRENSKELPDKKALRDILNNHKSQKFGEAGGAGTLDNFFYGGRNYTETFGDKGGEATGEVIQGLFNAFNAGELSNVMYFTHDHPYNTSINPSNGDRLALNTFRFLTGNTNMYGILIFRNKVNIFEPNGDGNDVIIKRTELEKRVE